MALANGPFHETISHSSLWRAPPVSKTCPRPRFHPYSHQPSVIPVIAARLVYLQPAYSPTPTWSAITPALLTETALACSITTGCATALRPFLRAFHPTNVVDAARLAKSANRLSSDRYYRLDNFLHGSGSSVSAPPARTRAGASRTGAAAARFSASEEACRRRAAAFRLRTLSGSRTRASRRTRRRRTLRACTSRAVGRSKRRWRGGAGAGHARRRRIRRGMAERRTHRRQSWSP